MGLLRRLRRAVEGEPSTRWECRNCGKTLSADADECPNCGAEDIASYEL
jgi:rubrerythrin